MRKKSVPMPSFYWNTYWNIGTRLEQLQKKRRIRRSFTYHYNKPTTSIYASLVLNDCPSHSPEKSAITVYEDRSRIPILLLLLLTQPFMCLFLKHHDSSNHVVTWSKWFMSVFSAFSDFGLPSGDWYIEVASQSLIP